MSVITALAGLKTAFQGISVPAGVSLGGRVWAWPADRASVVYSTFPFILCAQVYNEAGRWLQASQGVGFHAYPVEALICLNNWSHREDVTADDEADAQAWLLAAAAVLFNNRSLGGVALDIGSAEALLTTQIGEMGWLAGMNFYGVYIKTLVTEVHSLPSI
jgi:hypothetical protein